MKNTYAKQSLADRRIASVAVFTTFIFFVGFMVISGPAWSFQVSEPGAAIPVPADKPMDLTMEPSPVLTDADRCQSLLYSARHVSVAPDAAMDRTRRAAGKATAVGLIFGVRFALGPKEVSGTSRKDRAVKFDVWQPRDSDTSGAKAMAVADYRRCKNEEALKALSDWRWAR